MTEVAVRRLTFEDLVEANVAGYYELVDGQLEELVAPKPHHSWTITQFIGFINPYLLDREPEAFWGTELDIPTIPFFGRRPDFAYYSTTAATIRMDLSANCVLAPPTLVVEIVSPGDEERDVVTKRSEYALAGIEHYWILDPQRHSALVLRLEDGRYIADGEFFRGDVLTSGFFPGLKSPLSRLFRS